MSILIKGMKMPKSCEQCKFSGITGISHERVSCSFTGRSRFLSEAKYLEDCPLVETVDYFNHGVMLTMVKQTNADRIRAMSNEELAKWIDNNMCVLGHGCPCEKCEQPYKRPCDGAWLEWLKQECEG